MIINCTKKLQDELKIKPVKLDVMEPLFSWHVNIIRVNRRKTIVAANDASGFVIVIHGVVANDFKSIKELIVQSIKTILIADCVKPEIVKRYLADAGEIVFSKTQNSSLIAKMNRACQGADVYDADYIPDVKIQDGISRKVNKWIFLHKGKDLFHPHEVFYKLLEEKYNQTIFSTKALVLKVKLDLDNFDIWRRVVVPLNMSFYELHKVIRNAYDWGYYHLHEFVIYDKDKPKVRIVSQEDDFEMPFNDVEICLERDTFINEFLPKLKNIEYVYDFGDDWVHNVIVEDVLFDYDKNYASCLEGQGDRPPEDVGGEGGYENFVEIMNDPSHDEYEHMKQWYESKYYKGFDIDLVNRRLKYLH